VEEICATRKGREEKFVSDNSKCIKGVGEGDNFQFPQWGRYSKDVFFGMYHFIQILTKTIV
jgi:hypothetical protein